MSGKVFFLPLSFLIIFSFKNNSPGTRSFQSILAEYRRTDILFRMAGDAGRTDSICMRGFRQVISDLIMLASEKKTDSLLYQANYKLGILYDLNRNYAGATLSYRRALDYAAVPEERFRMYVLAGAGYYNQNNFDSASYFLLRAETKVSRTFSFEDRIRLYNTLGVLYYDNGNYLLSKNYLTQALRLITPKNHADDFANSIQLNLATCFYKLGMYHQALGIYRGIPVSGLLTDPLLMNMGRAYAGLHFYDSALASFKKVKISAVPGVLNEMAKTYIESGNTMTAASLLIQYQNNKSTLHTNALDDGVNAFYSGELDIRLEQPESALQHFQQALNIFSGSFSTLDIRENPRNFSGSFAYYRLFEVLEKKAMAWGLVYKTSSRPEDLESAFDTYQSAISLISYIERSYEMDDAKLLLKQKSGELFSNALTACLDLNRIFPKAGFLEQAFLISEKNKASVMGSQIRQMNFFQSTGQGNELTAEERNIRFNIARLNTLSEDHQDASALQKINDEKSVYETRLVNLRKKMEGNSRFYQLKYSDDFPSVQQLQNRLKNDQALISFFNEADRIVVFILTKSSLDHIQLNNGNPIRQQVQSWIQTLQTSENGRHVNTNAINEYLYKQLMKPILGLAGNKKEWIVIPDGLFFQLPIESLYGDEDGSLVIENHAVSYEFSARFILADESITIDPGSAEEVLAFAPFSLNGLDMQKEGMGRLEKLPYSREEISGLKGSRFSDKQGTKVEFLKNINRFPIIHLATHAVTDLQNPSASFIAFYPAAGNRSEDFLFLDQIYSLRMDSCRLIVISACETGRGELVHNEGVMSFARAFLYSGCPSTINTLWKADDHSTAEILKLFYKYLEEGNSKTRALQKAKLEFIRNFPVYRDPAYWSHIVLTGDPGPLYKKKQPWVFWAVFAMICGTIGIIVILKRKEKKVDAFHS